MDIPERTAPVSGPEGEKPMSPQKYKQKHMMNASPVAARLRQVRKHIGLKQVEMAERLGITRDSYGKNERGHALVSTDVLDLLHHKLGVSVEWLLFNNGPMYWKATESAAQKTPKNLRLNPQMTDMVDHMNRFSFVYNSVIGFFQKYKVENKHLLTKENET